MGWETITGASAADQRAQQQMEDEQRQERLFNDLESLIDASIRPYLELGLSNSCCAEALESCAFRCRDKDNEGRDW